MQTSLQFQFYLQYLILCPISRSEISICANVYMPQRILKKDRLVLMKCKLKLGYKSYIEMINGSQSQNTCNVESRILMFLAPFAKMGAAGWS